MTGLNKNWSMDSLLEVTLPNPDNFLKVKETLTRMGIASQKYKKLYQTAHILHKKGRYYIVHFKELFLLDHKNANLEPDDIERRNAIAVLLDEWGLVKLVSKPEVNMETSLSHLKVVSYKEKDEWELIPKYNIGQKRVRGTTHDN
jgi:hypothetical protein